MATTFDDHGRYWGASRRVRGAYARQTLAALLAWAFGTPTQIANLSEEEIHRFLDGVRGSVGVVEPAWAPTMISDLRESPVEGWRSEMVEAFAKIRALAKDVSTRKSSAMIPMAVEIYASPDNDREGRPLWGLNIGTAEALVWFALRLFAEVPRSLIRTCDIPDCGRVYVGIKNQHYCPRHQAEARREAQRNAERAFRKRQRAKKSTTKRRTSR